MIVNANLNPAADAHEAPGKVKLAATPLAPGRAGAKPEKSRLASAAVRIEPGRETLAVAGARIADMASADEALQIAKRSILARPDAAMSAQANAMPQSALRLLA